MKSNIMLSLALALSFISSPVLADVCVGDLQIVCEEKKVETELTLSPVGVPTVSASSVDTGDTVLISVNGNASLDSSAATVSSGTVIASTPQSVVVQASADGRLDITNLNIQLTDSAYIGDKISLFVSRRNPNGTAEVIEEKTFETFIVKGFETANIKLINPASNDTQFSVLRLINDSSEEGMVILTAVDDKGNSAGPVTALIPANSVLTLNSAELELGSEKTAGSFGDGSGKWRVRVDSDFIGLRVQSLIRNNQTGTLTEVQ